LRLAPVHQTNPRRLRYYGDTLGFLAADSPSADLGRLHAYFDRADLGSTDYSMAKTVVRGTVGRRVARDFFQQIIFRSLRSLTH
jgi:hypothetical protein